MTIEEAHPFTDTPQFNIMRKIVGASNPLIRWLLGSRLAGPLARSLLLLRYMGRKSGRTFSTPMGYVRKGTRVVVVTSPVYTWWRNVVAGADVEVRLDGQWRTARAQLLTPDGPGYDDAVAFHVARRGPGMLRRFGLSVGDDGRVPPEARAAAPSPAHIVQIDLTLDSANAS